MIRFPTLMLKSLNLAGSHEAFPAQFIPMMISCFCDKLKGFFDHSSAFPDLVAAVLCYINSSLRKKSNDRKRNEIIVFDSQILNKLSFLSYGALGSTKILPSFVAIQIYV